LNFVPPCFLDLDLDCRNFGPLMLDVDPQPAKRLISEKAAIR
jgi:hypothetical protein